jgi:hypothetical protein
MGNVITRMRSVRENRAHFDRHVWRVVEQLGGAGKVVGVPAKVRGDELRLRMLAEHVVALGQQLVERHPARLVVASIGKQRQLEPALVVHVERLEEFLRLRGVDERRHAEAGKRRPDRVEFRIVDSQPRSVGLPVAQPERLRHFADADCAGFQVRFELRDGQRAPTGADVAEVDAGQHTEAIFVRARARSPYFYPRITRMTRIQKTEMLRTAVVQAATSGGAA